MSAPRVFCGLIGAALVAVGTMTALDKASDRGAVGVEVAALMLGAKRAQVDEMLELVGELKALPSLRVAVTAATLEAQQYLGIGDKPGKAQALLLSLRPVPVIAGAASVWALPGLTLMGFAVRPGRRPVRREPLMDEVEK